tara:strand:+ start:121 stop:432 length:312 start_codon:yes stop_codon:yes gene_type:complete
MVKMVIKQSTNAKKKLMAIFYEKGKDGKLKKKKTTHFGQRGAPDFTITKDKEQRARYIKRHTNARENHSAYTSAGALSRHILWGSSTSRSANISAYKRRFGLS